VDVYAIAVDSAGLSAGRDEKLTLAVTKNGQAVTDLRPCPGTCAHLTAIRAGDLAAVHPVPDRVPLYTAAVTLPI
jgi:hypothetical protein